MPRNVVTLLCVINYYAQPTAATTPDKSGSALISSETQDDERVADRILLGSLMKLEVVTNTVDVRSNQSGFTAASST